MASAEVVTVYDNNEYRWLSEFKIDICDDHGEMESETEEKEEEEDIVANSSEDKYSR